MRGKEHFQLFRDDFLFFLLYLLGLEKERKFLDYCLEGLGWKKNVLAVTIAHDVNRLLRDLESTSGDLKTL